ncbi:hypothetical protein FVE85_7030 [Porphyridium purpureum]|uniref:Uncharacterized protein n=1 Tax=Porphyridium purpureum TaxID=35688 RepID=A0A5J4Z802_PORPP|nr:hypothetical protein FVE85_7030 [Porphyridium purpureum]|eukprot:POR3260..scf295_1
MKPSLRATVPGKGKSKGPGLHVSAPRLNRMETATPMKRTHPPAGLRRSIPHGAALKRKTVPLESAEQNFGKESGSSFNKLPSATTRAAAALTAAKENQSDENQASGRSTISCGSDESLPRRRERWRRGRTKAARIIIKGSRLEGRMLALLTPTAIPGTNIFPSTRPPVGVPSKLVSFHAPPTSQGQASPQLTSLPLNESQDCIMYSASRACAIPVSMSQTLDDVPLPSLSMSLSQGSGITALLHASQEVEFDDGQQTR